MNFPKLSMTASTVSARILEPYRGREAVLEPWMSIDSLDGQPLLRVTLQKLVDEVQGGLRDLGLGGDPVVYFYGPVKNL